MYNRGIHKFQSLFDDQPQTQVIELTTVKGRDTEMSNQKNECIAARAYYYRTFFSMEYTTMCANLSADFWLREITIKDLLKSYSETIRKHMNEKTTIEQLRKLYPQYTW